MSAVADEEAGYVNACLGEGTHFFEEDARVDHYAVAYDGDSVLVEDAGRNQALAEGAVLVDDSVTCVGSAVAARDYACLLAKQVNDFSFTLIAPLATYNCYYGQITPPGITNY